MPCDVLAQRRALRALANGKATAELDGDLFVGRTAELALFDDDLEIVDAGGAVVRILVGEQGSGKTILQQAMATAARARGFVTSHVDLTMDNLLHGRGGEGRKLLRETVLAMRTASSGDALAVDSIVGRLGNDCRTEASSTGQLPREYLRGRLGELSRHPKGAEFARVIGMYALAAENSSIAENARRWLCGDYATITDARDELGVGSIVEDPDFWLMARHWASVARIAGRKGLVLFLDEARILCDLNNPNARSLNLEQLMVILNDVLQGRVEGIAVVIAATPSFVTQWSGLAKHKGLNSCLSHQKDAIHLGDHSDNVLIHLQDFSEHQLVELLQRCRELYGACHPAAPLLPDEGIGVFLETCRNQIGDALWHLPRTILQRFIAFHDRFAARPDRDWRDVLFASASDSANPEREFDGYAERHM
jgi:hypothetical protein